MRNLKKILALVLALVMSLSLMATAGASSFQDVTDDNPYKTAIDVLDQLKVFQGFEDGSFKPTDTLNRAQAAVLVYRIATGDVEGKYVDNYTYMAQSKFVDLDGYNWAKGYINYCQNAEIVVGTDATHFAPGAKVTGYQLLVMLLRTLGYGKAGEFSDPRGWELQTATIAGREGITKNVTAGDFGAAAPRQMVAEILFRGLLTPTVEYNPTLNGGYAKSSETLGKKNLGLEEISGVVMANEYASLTSASTKKDGKTDLLVDGKTYTIDYTTDLDDIGEARHAYIQNNSKVLYLDGTGMNTVETSTNAEKVDDVLSRAGISGGGEKYLNFAKVFKRDCAYKLKYVLMIKDGKIGDSNAKDVWQEIKDANADASLTPSNKEKVATGDGKLEVTIAPHKNISDVDEKWMENIFAKADLTGYYGDTIVEGEIYVGTQSTNDISDVKPDQKYSWESFKEEFIEETENDAAYDKNNNGNWVKVIDNDGDGVADYIFKVVYTFAQVSKANDGAYTLDVKDEVLNEGDWGKVGHSDKDINDVDDEKVVCEETLEKGDIVYYAVIDGKVQAYKAEVVANAKIDKVDRSKLTASVVDGETYTQSEVHEHIIDEMWLNNVRNLVGGVSYDLYLDRGGYLGAFVKSELGGNFVLLTDGWFMAQRGGDEYAAKVYNDETGEQDDTTITENGNLFILGADGNTGSQNNSWGLLKAFGGNSTGVLKDNGGALNNDPNTGDNVRTIVAALDEDGVLLPVDDDAIYTRTTKRMLDVTEKDKDGNYIVPGKNYTEADVYVSRGAVTAYDKQSNGDVSAEIRALESTTYYFVYYNNDSEYVVKKYDGYSSVPSLKTDDLEAIEDVYAVGTLVSRDSGYHDNDEDAGAADGNNGKEYYTADIVVVEFEKAYRSAAQQVFIYDTPVVGSNVKIDEVSLIDSNGESKTVSIHIPSSSFDYRTTALADAANGESNMDLGNDSIGYSNAKKQLVMPGLYWMYETSTEGVYTIENMTRAEIAKSDFVLGQVATSNYTGVDRYVDIATWNWDKDNAPAPYAQQNKADGKQDYSLSNLTDDTKYYTLAYGETSDGRDDKGVASLNESTWDEALAEMVQDVRYTEDNMRETLNKAETRTGLRNDVLALVKSGKVVYAVSFANLLDAGDYNTYYAGNRKYDFAQSVWEYILPLAPEAAVTMPTDWPLLYNGTIDLNATDIANGITVTTTGNTKDITVPYDVWSAWTELYTVKPHDAHNQIAVDNGTDLTMTSDPRNVLVAPDGNYEQTIYVMSQGDKKGEVTKLYTFHITLTQRNTDIGTLVVTDELKAKGVSVTNDDIVGATAEINVPDGNTLLGDIALGLRTTLGDDVKVEFVNADGTVLFSNIADPEVHTNSTIGMALSPFTMKVTNAAGYSKTINVRFTTTPVVSVSIPRGVTAQVEEDGLVQTLALDGYTEITGPAAFTVMAGTEIILTANAGIKMTVGGVTYIENEVTITAEDVDIAVTAAEKDDTSLDDFTVVDEATGKTTITVDVPVTLSALEVIDSDTVINLAEEGEINFEGKTGFVVRAGTELTIEGEGTISVDGIKGNLIELVNTEVDGAKTVLNIGEGVTLAAAHDNGAEISYAIVVVPGGANNDVLDVDAEINFNGKITGTEGMTVNGRMTGDVTINIGATAEIVTDDLGLYLAGPATTNIEDGAVITGGKTGIEIRAGVLNVKGGTITGSASTTTSTPNGSGSTTVGAGIAVVQHVTNLPLTVTVTNGTIVGNEPIRVIKKNSTATTNVNVNVSSDAVLTKDGRTDLAANGLFNYCASWTVLYDGKAVEVKSE